MNIDLSLPYITADLPGIGGQLRTTPNNFVVEELSLYEPEGQGEHLYVNLTREGMTTREVQYRLADIFGITPRDVGFAGLKDKYACTTQTFSLLVGKVDDNFINQAAERIRTNLPVTVNWTRLHKNKLKPGHLLGNRFTITVTNPKIPPDKALSRVQAIGTRLQERGLPNFFGPQRFGFNGDNVQRGLEIILGQLQNVDLWLRRFLISSYQSYLCNRYLVRRFESGTFDRILLGDIAKKYATGGLFQVKDDRKEQPRYENHEISFTAPIYGPRMWSATGPAGELEAEILAEAGLSLKQFGAVRVEGTRRLGRLLVPDLNVSLEPQGLRARFSLPKGAFATTILREIMKVDLQDSLSSFSSNTEY